MMMVDDDDDDDDDDHCLMLSFEASHFRTSSSLSNVFIEPPIP